MNELYFATAAAIEAANDWYEMDEEILIEALSRQSIIVWC